MIAVLMISDSLFEASRAAAHARQGSVEFAAVYSLPWIPRDAEPGAFLDFTAWLSLPAPRTHLRAIAKLQPGAHLVVPLDAPASASSRGPTPSFSLIFFSMPLEMSGLSRRKVRAFSLPCPSWSPS